MKNKGFTLVELLAVLVILAIIALIAIPIVAKTVLKASEDSDAISVEMYINAVNTSLMAQKADNLIRNATCDIQENGNLNCNGKIVEVHVEKTVPQSGKIIIERMKVKNILNLKIGDYYYNYDENKELVSSLDPAEEDTQN